MEHFLFDTESETFITLRQLRKEFEAKRDSGYWGDEVDMCFCGYYVEVTGSQGTLETVEKLVAFAKKYDISFVLLEDYIAGSHLTRHECLELVGMLRKLYFSGGNVNG